MFEIEKNGKISLINPDVQIYNYSFSQEQLLDNWGLLHLNHYFVTAKILLTEDFQRITMEDLNRIVAGHMDFVEVCDLRDYFQTWKTNKSNPVPSSSTGIEDSTETVSLLTKTKNLPAKIQFGRNVEEPHRDFGEYMKKTLLNRILLDKFGETKQLTSNQKASVIRTAAEYILLNVSSFPTDFPRKTEYIHAANQVQLVFPGAFSDQELLGSVKIDEQGKVDGRSRGKLAQRIYDISKHMKDKNKRKQDGKGSDNQLSENGANEIEDDEDVVEFEALATDSDDDEDELEVDVVAQQALDFVKTSKGPESKILTEWEKSVTLRKTLDFSDFPALNTTFGHKLITWDFNFAYPGKIQEFREQFELLKNKMMCQFNQEVSDSIGKEMLFKLGR